MYVFRQNLRSLSNLWQKMFMTLGRVHDLMQDGNGDRSETM